MKKMKNMIALLLAFTMVMAMGMTAFAAKTVNVGTGTGSITLENGTTGEKYQLYKVFDATYSGDNVAYTFTKTDANAAFYALLTADASPFTLTATATENEYTVVKKDTASDAVILSWVETNVKDKDYLKVGAEIELAEADEQAIEWTNLAYGYYMITSTLDDYESGKSHVTIDSNVPDATVIDKNQTPSFDKNIVDDPENPVKINEANIDEEVDFDITVESKNYDGKDKIFKYVVYDTLEPGWTLKAAPVVKIDGETKTAATDYTISYYTDDTKATAAKTDLSDAQYFEITIPWTTDGTKAGTHLYKANDEIQVTYTAFLDKEKFEEIHVGATPNKNTADVKYFKGDDNSTTPSGDLPDVITETYETAVTILKTDENGDPLTGAEFQLTSTDGSQITIVTGSEYQEHTGEGKGTYYKLNDGTYTDEAPTGDAEHDAVYEDTTKTYDLVDVSGIQEDGQNTDIKAFVGADGKLTFSGLGVGTYTLTETTVPAGYNKAADVTFKITFDPATKKFASNNAKVVLNSTNNVFDTTIENQSGTELPSTGGIGTTMFYVIGTVLVLGAAVLLISKRRMNVR